MDPAPLVVLAILVIAASGIFWFVSQGQKRQAAWRTLADQLGLHHEGSPPHGEYEGLPVRITMEMRHAAGGYSQFSTAEGQVLIEEPEVQKALLEFYSPLRVGFVEKNQVHVAYESWLSNAEEARGAMKDVVHAARTLAAAQARLAPGSTPASTS